MPECRVLIADDNTMFLNSLARFLSTLEGFSIVGTTTRGGEVAEMVRALRPNVVLVDLTLGDLDGLAVARAIKSRPDHACVIIISLFASEEYRAAARSSGADDFIGKSDLGDRLLPAIRACHYCFT